MHLDLDRNLIFVFGKGGVGRSTISSAMALASARRNQETLLVEWALQDSIAPLFGLEEAGHKHIEIAPHFSIMNFSDSEALREYFVDHLGLKLLYKFIIENKHVSRLIQAAPGLAELFFLGRLYWLVELAEEERGIHFDRIIVDAPATGHGGALFGIVATVSEFQFTGPLIDETKRVTSLIRDASKTGAVVVCLPEEMPVDESLEFLPELRRDLNADPLGVILNRSIVNPGQANNAESLAELQKEFSSTNEELNPAVLNQFLELLQNPESQVGIKALYADLRRRIKMEQKLRQNCDVPVLAVPDILIQNPLASPRERIELLARYF